MTMTLERMCDACGMGYSWQPFLAGGKEYCCEPCSIGEPCACPQHDHGATTEPMASRAGAGPLGAPTNVR